MTAQNNTTIFRSAFLKRAATVFKESIFAAATLSILLISTAKAQDRAITLDEAIKLGLQNSNVLKLSQAEFSERLRKLAATDPQPRSGGGF